MKTLDQIKSENKDVIVAFHVGRGGRFNNQGYLTVLDERPIGHYTSDLFLNEETGEYHDGAGNEVGLTLKEEETGIGCINIDNDYNTTYTTRIGDLTDKELEAIRRSQGFCGLIVEEIREVLKAMKRNNNWLKCGE